MSSPLTFNILFALASATAYFFVAQRLGIRQLADPEDRFAWNAFRWVWSAQALGRVMAAISTLLAVAEVLNLTLHIALGMMVLFALVLALWGLLYYMVYLYTGNQNWSRAITVFYALYYVYLVGTALARQPLSVQVGDSGATLAYAQPANPVFGLSYLIILLAPQLIASIFLFALTFRISERSQKYRAFLVSGSIFIWFGSAFLAAFSPLGQLPWWSLASQLIGLATALLIYWAYFPPMMFQKLLRVTAVE